MNWNYRVIRNDLGVYRIHEVYYDDDGNPESWTIESTEPLGTSVDDLRQDLLMMLAALDEPALQQSRTPRLEEVDFVTELEDEVNAAETDIDNLISPEDMSGKPL